MKRLFAWRTMLAFLVIASLTVLLAYTVASLVATHALLPTESQKTQKDPRIRELKDRSPTVQDIISPFKQRDRK